MGARLEVEGIALRFGGVKVLEDVGFHAEPGEIVGLVGPNGAGKTSLFNCISGHYTPSAGSVSIDGVDVVKMSPWRMSQVGLARTFQHPALQLNASLVENVVLGAHPRLRGGPFAWSFRLPYAVRSEREARVEAETLLARFGLSDIANKDADEVSHGLHKAVELCRALMSRPKLLLLDEPAAGLSSTEVEQFIQIVREVRDEFDLTIVIVEHHMGVISAITDRVVVLEHGRKLVEGTAAEVQANPRVIEAYLGKGAEDDAA